MNEVLNSDNPKTPISPLESPHSNQANKQASILIIPCLSVDARLLSPICDLKHLDATFSESKPGSQIQNPRGPLLRFRFLTLFMTLLLPNFSRIAERQLQILGNPQMEDTFSVVRTN
jgi:hypothetical protein